jgi:hypothetical protein
MSDDLIGDELVVARRRVAEAEARLVEQDEILRALTARNIPDGAALMRRRIEALQEILAQRRVDLEILASKLKPVKAPEPPTVTVSRRRQDQRQT